MLSSTSSSEPHASQAPAAEPAVRVVGTTLLTSARYLCAVVVVTLLLGEAYMRLPFVARRLEYEPDPVLGGRLAPNQFGYIWLAQMSLQSPPITINRDGFRGYETDWTQPVVLILGDSEWFGAGVTDDEVWTSRLEPALRADTALPTLQVVNAAHPGDGPYHQLVVARRVLATHRVEAILCLVAIEQRNFHSIPEGERGARFAEAERRQLIRRVSLFLPFLFNKIEAQLPSVRQALRPSALRSADTSSDEITRAVERDMWQSSHQWWEHLAAEAAVRSIPILFVIQDLRHRPASDELAVHLQELARNFGTASATRIGPRDFGLGDVPRAELSRTLKQRLTLRRDPHANAEQHRMLAEALRLRLQGSGLTAQIAQQTRMRANGTAPAASCPHDRLLPTDNAPRSTRLCVTGVQPGF